MVKKIKLKNTLLLFITALIWGNGFVAQSLGTNYLTPFAFNGIRALLGGIVLLPFVFFRARTAKAGTPNAPSPDNAGTPGTSYESKRSAAHTRPAETHTRKVSFLRDKTLLAGGLVCGLCFTLGSTFQQFGIQYTTAGKAGFITAFYIVLVPVLGLFVGQRTSSKIWLPVGMALVGLYLLCVNGRLHLGRGDLLIFICAVMFSFHILAINHYAPKTDGVTLSCIQFFICGVLCLICMFLFEDVHFADIMRAAKPLLYAGVVSCGIAYTLQILGQRDYNPTVASLILSLESSISAISGYFILHEHLSARELTGCVVMFAAVVLAQIPKKERKEVTNIEQERNQ